MQGELNTTITTLTARNAKLAKDNKSLQAASESPEEDSDYREVPELGVKYKVTDETKDLTYVYSEAGADRPAASFSTLAILNQGTGDEDDTNECAKESGAAGVIVRYTSKDLNTDGVLLDTTIKKELDKKSPTVKKIGSNYFVYSKPNGISACSESLISASRKAANDAFKSLVAITN